MNARTVTIPKSKLEELESRIDKMHETARACVEKCERLLRIARGEQI